MNHDRDQRPWHDGESTPVLILTVMRFLNVMWRRRNVVVQTLMLTGAAGLMYYALAPRQYESAARLLIIEPQQDQVASAADPHNSEVTMATHSELVTSPVVIGGAIRRLAPAYRVDLVHKPPEEWVETLSKQLDASAARGTNFIDVSYRSSHPVAAAAVVRSVIESYLAFVRDTHQGTLTQSLRQAQECERQLAAAIEHARSTAAKHSGQSVELATLQRDVERIEKLHDLLFDRVANVAFRQVQAPIQVKVVREPLPEWKSVTPQLRFVLIASVLVGLTLGAGIAYVRDVFGDRFDSPHEHAGQPGAPVLAMVHDLEPLAEVTTAIAETNDLPAVEQVASSTPILVIDNQDEGVDADEAPDVLAYRPSALPGADEVRELIRPRRAA